MDVEMSYIRRIVGVDIKADEAVNYLAKMSINATPSANGDILSCQIPF